MNTGTTFVIGLALLMAVPVGAISGQASRRDEMGLGMVKLPIDLESPIYFFGEPSSDPSADVELPVDSLTFAEAQYFIDVATAPAWFQPEVIKLDYDLLFVRAVGLRRDWIEVVVNRTTGLTAWLERDAVEYLDWPTFLLDAFAVEQIDPNRNPIRVRPQDNADRVRTDAEALYPLTIHGDWMQVMLDMDGARTGWIKWRDGWRLLVSFFLLS